MNYVKKYEAPYAYCSDPECESLLSPHRLSYDNLKCCYKTALSIYGVRPFYEAQKPVYMITNIFKQAYEMHYSHLVPNNTIFLLSDFQKK